jgi:hypothetical protein
MKRCLNKATEEWFAGKFQDDLIATLSGKEAKVKKHKRTREDIARERAAGSAFSSFCF